MNLKVGKRKKLIKKRWLASWVLYYLPNPPLEQDMTQGQFLSGV